jgi:hypothetical protein
MAKKIKEEIKEEIVKDDFEVLINEDKTKQIQKFIIDIKENIKKLKFIEFNQFYFYEKSNVVVKYYKDTKQAKLVFLNTVLAIDFKNDTLDIIEHKSNSKEYDLISILCEIKYNTDNK